jgi:hypothetical protein
VDAGGLWARSGGESPPGPRRRPPRGAGGQPASGDPVDQESRPAVLPSQLRTWRTPTCRRHDFGVRQRPTASNGTRTASLIRVSPGRGEEGSRSVTVWVEQSSDASGQCTCGSPRAVRLSATTPPSDPAAYCPAPVMVGPSGRSVKHGGGDPIRVDRRPSGVLPLRVGGVSGTGWRCGSGGPHRVPRRNPNGKVRSGCGWFALGRTSPPDGRMVSFAISPRRHRAEDE